MIFDDDDDAENLYYYLSYIPTRAKSTKKEKGKEEKERARWGANPSGRERRTNANKIIPTTSVRG